MATKRIKVESNKPGPNKEIGYFNRFGDASIASIDDDGGFTLEHASLDDAKTAMESDYEWDEEGSVAYTYKVTVERVLKASKPPLVFEKV